MFFKDTKTSVTDEYVNKRHSCKKTTPNALRFTANNVIADSAVIVNRETADSNYAKTSLCYIFRTNRACTVHKFSFLLSRRPHCRYERQRSLRSRPSTFASADSTLPTDSLLLNNKHLKTAKGQGMSMGRIKM